MISERDIFRSAQVLINLYGHEAFRRADERIFQMMGLDKREDPTAMQRIRDAVRIIESMQSAMVH